MSRGLHQKKMKMMQQYPQIEWCRTNVNVPFRCRKDGVQDRTVHLVASEEPQQAYQILCNTEIPPSSQKVFHGICYAMEYTAIRIPRIPVETAVDDDEDTNRNDDPLEEFDETNTILNNNETNGLIVNEPTISTPPVFLKSTTSDDKDVYERVTITCVNKSKLEQCYCWKQQQNENEEDEDGMLLVVEDPYNDILLLQTIGDGIHVVECIEVLQNKDFLFIVTPYVQDNLSHWNVPLSEDIARGYFRQMIDILKYLRSKGICHGNLSPDKFGIDTTTGRLILTGLGWIGGKGKGGFVTTRTLVVENTIGKYLQRRPTYVSPEVFMMLPYYNPYALDLWSSVIILFSLLTGGGTLLYDKPTYEDPLFCYFILAGGISPNNQNSILCSDALADMKQQPQQVAKFLNLFEKCSLLSPEAIELLENALRLNVEGRWSLDDVETCSWVRGTQIEDEIPIFGEAPRSNPF